MNNKQQQLSFMLECLKEQANIINKEIIKDTPFGMYDEKTLSDVTYLFIHVISNISIESGILTPKNLDNLFLDIKNLTYKYCK
jgi:uncharacterized protein YfkK (UPF0435 family)